MATSKRSATILFSDPHCPYCHRVRMVLAEKKIVVEIVDVDVRDMPEEIMELNPYGTVPTFVDRELQLYESQVIMEYLDERFPHPSLMPIDPVARAKNRLYMYRIDRDWYTPMREILHAKNAKQAQAARNRLCESLVATAPVFGAHRFFMNDEFSLIDCCLAPLLWRLPLLNIELPAPATPILDYARRIFEWPSFGFSLSEIEREMAATATA